jgi:DICT domain-containing protein
LFRYCQGVIDFDARISGGAFDLCMPEQKLDRPEISSSEGGLQPKASSAILATKTADRDPPYGPI